MFDTFDNFREIAVCLLNVDQKVDIVTLKTENLKLHTAHSTSQLTTYHQVVKLVYNISSVNSCVPYSELILKSVFTPKVLIRTKF